MSELIDSNNQKEGIRRAFHYETELKRVATTVGEGENGMENLLKILEAVNVAGGVEKVRNVLSLVEMMQDPEKTAYSIEEIVAMMEKNPLAGEDDK